MGNSVCCCCVNTKNEEHGNIQRVNKNKKNKAPNKHSPPHEPQQYQLATLVNEKGKTAEGAPTGVSPPSSSSSSSSSSYVLIDVAKLNALQQQQLQLLASSPSAAAQLLFQQQQLLLLQQQQLQQQQIQQQQFQQQQLGVLLSLASAATTTAACMPPNLNKKKRNASTSPSSSAASDDDTTTASAVAVDITASPSQGSSSSSSSSLFSSTNSTNSSSSAAATTFSLISLSGSPPPRRLASIVSPSHLLLFSRPSSHFAWHRLHDDERHRRYFFNCLTGESTWREPTSQLADAELALSLPVHLVHFYAADRLCRQCGITLDIVTEATLDATDERYDDDDYYQQHQDDDQLQADTVNEASSSSSPASGRHLMSIVDPVYGTSITGSPFSLGQCLFYQPLLLSELSVYPVDFIRRHIGLRRIVLCRHLAYDGQKRGAIPVVKTRTLYLDVDVQDVVYKQNIFHHELFHMIDDVMAGLLKGMPASNGLANGDDEWERTNVKGFAYGTGGEFNREQNMFISLSDATSSTSKSPSSEFVPGFLNRYAKTAVEEDKAEVFATLIRHWPSLVCSNDYIFRAKSNLMRVRLEKFCGSMNVEFWDRALVHSPYPQRFSNAVAWREKVDVKGNTYWLNPLSRQISWVKPVFLVRQHEHSLRWTLPSTSAPAPLSVNTVTNAASGGAVADELARSQHASNNKHDNPNTDNLDSSASRDTSASSSSLPHTSTASNTITIVKTTKSSSSESMDGDGTAAAVAAAVASIALNHGNDNNNNHSHSNSVQVDSSSSLPSSSCSSPSDTSHLLTRNKSASAAASSSSSSSTTSSRRVHRAQHSAHLQQ